MSIEVDHPLDRNCNGLLITYKFVCSFVCLIAIHVFQSISASGIISVMVFPGLNRNPKWPGLLDTTFRCSFNRCLALIAYCQVQVYSMHLNTIFTYAGVAKSVKALYADFSHQMTFKEDNNCNVIQCY